MNATTIRDVKAWEALDSRGRPTVGCTVRLAGGGEGRAVVPAGASTGGYEARERRDGGSRYEGWGVEYAIQAVNGEIAASVRGMDADEQEAVDTALEVLDGGDDLGRLGANAVLSVSVATALASCSERRQPLWQRMCAERAPLVPMPMVNIVSGGLHARTGLDIQDVLAIPAGAESFREAIEWVSRIRLATAQLLDEKGGVSALVADEGGLAALLSTNEAAVELVAQGVESAGFALGSEVSLALDVAANQLYDEGFYWLRLEQRRFDSAEWLSLLGDWSSRYAIASLEDVLHEDDWDGWKRASKLAVNVQIIGDDLFATNLARLERGIELGVANAVLVKPNQAGTLTRAGKVAERAQRAGYRTVVSTRSGDTEDYWLADLAVGWHGGQIKVGSTQRSERTAKWNRFLEIESELGESSQLWRFPGADRHA